MEAKIMARFKIKFPYYFLLAFSIFSLVSSVSFAQVHTKTHANEARVHDVTRTDPQRRLLLDALRPRIERDLGSPVVFVVRQMRIGGNYAFLSAEAQRPNGIRINARNTPFGRKNPEGLEFWDCCQLQAVFQKINGRWQVLDSAIGATDVWYIEYCDTVPNGLFLGCEYH